jgi:hypothetical protein
MTLTEAQRDEIADGVVERFDDSIADLDIADAVAVVEAVQESLSLRCDAMLEDLRRRAAAAEASE